MKLYVLFNKTKYNNEYEFIGVFDSLIAVNNKTIFCEKKYPHLFAESKWQIKETELNELY